MSTSDKIRQFDNLIMALNKIIFGEGDVVLDGSTKPTIDKFLKSIATNGWYEEPFPTESALLQSAPTKSRAVAKALDTKKVFYWDGSSWADTGLSELDLAKSYADGLLSQIPEPPQIEILTGEQLYDRAKDNPTQIFNAIWQEYNKPVYHIGNGTFVDVTGVTVVPYVVIPELIFTIKTLVDNETFTFPTVNVTTSPINMNIDWGDRTSETYTSYNVAKTYTAPAGSEFQIKVRGSAIPFFDFSSNNGGRRISRLSVKSIDKNTLPARSMARFNLSGCDNIQYICNEAFQSFSGTTFIFTLSSFKNVTFHKDAFKGLQHVTSIDNLFGGVTSNGLYTLPAGLFDYFISVTSAVSLFRNLNSPIPDGILDKMMELQNAANMFFGAKVTAIPQRIYKNQKKLVTVTSCFRLSNIALDAFVLYTDMNQGSPSAVGGVFYTANSMTNLANVPVTWKSAS